MRIHHQGYERNAKLGQRGSERGHVTYFWNFRTPSISLELLELETSNLACRFVTSGTNERNAKLGQRGSGRGHVTYFWNFGTPSISRERLELRTSNLARRFIKGDTNDRNAKLGQRGSERNHVTYFWNFGTLSICLERLELGTSNLARRFIVRGINKRNVKLGQRARKGSERGHVTYFWNFRTPSISLELLKLETSNLACRFVTSGTNERNARLGQRGLKGSCDLLLTFWHLFISRQRSSNNTAVDRATLSKFGFNRDLNGVHALFRHALFRHLDQSRQLKESGQLNLTPQNSDPAKIRDIGAPELNQRPKGNFRGSGTQFCCVATHFNRS